MVSGRTFIDNEEGTTQHEKNILLLKLKRLASTQSAEEEL